MASAVIPPTPVVATIIHDITSSTIIDTSTAGILDNRSPFRQNNFHSYRASGSGTWSVDMQWADGSPTGFVSYGSTAQVDQSSSSGIGFGLDPSSFSGQGFHDFVKFVVTGDAQIQSYSGIKNLWSYPSQGAISFPVSVENGGTGGSTAPVASFNSRIGNVVLTAADITDTTQDLQTSASPTFNGLATTTATISTFTSTSGTITTLTATSAAIAALTATSAAVTRTGAVPVTVTRTDGGTALSVVIGDVVLASGTLTASGTVTGGALVTAGSLTAASGNFSGNVSVGGTLSVGAFSSTTPLVITVASGTPLTLSQSSGGTALSLVVGSLVLSAGNIVASGSLTASSASISGALTSASAAISGAVTAASVTLAGDLASATAHVSGNAVIGGSVSGASLSVSGAASAASASIAGALAAASAAVTGAASAASVKITAIASYVDNAAAVGASVPVGTLYRITGSDNLAIVH